MQPKLPYELNFPLWLCIHTIHTTPKHLTWIWLGIPYPGRRNGRSDTADKSENMRFKTTTFIP